MDNKFGLLSVALFLGLALCGLFIGRSIERFKKEDRYISVKGFSEREVKSNMAVWNIKTRITTNDIIDGSKEIEMTKNKIVQFLLENGIKQEEIIQKDLNVNDKVASDYGSGTVFKYRFVIENTLQVRSNNVETIQKVSRMTDELLKVGVVVSNDQGYDPSVKYIYTKLNEIKPEMLSEATMNAKKAGLEFTNKSEVKLGNLRKASQGLFSISDRDDYLTSQTDGGGFGAGVNDIYKKVRVVVNVDYSIN